MYVSVESDVCECLVVRGKEQWSRIYTFSNAIS